mgnify:CR=1 FL=1
MGVCGMGDNGLRDCGHADRIGAEKALLLIGSDSALPACSATVYLADAAKHGEYNPDVHKKLVLDVVQRENADCVVFVHSSYGWDLAPRVVPLLNLQGVGRLLDLGGGPATYAITFAQAEPGLKATVFDLPGPVEIARENIRRHGLEDRVDTLSGNFLEDELGGPYDFIWVSQILHSHTEEQCRLIIGKSVAALNPGGQLAIQDFFLNNDGSSPTEAALFSVHMLAVTPGGRSYTHQEVAEMMRQAGLDSPSHHPTSPNTSILVARKAS